MIGKSQQELTPEPRFYLNEKKLESFQYDYFGFYAIAKAYRGILLSINYLVAGDINLSKKLLGPSVSSYYTCAYHLLDSFLALKGRIIISKNTEWNNNRINIKDQFVIASFTKGKWHFQTKKWGHAGKWQELKQLRLKEYPDSFIHLFKYWYNFRVKEKTSMSDYIKKRINGEHLGTPISIQDITDEFLKRITEARHESIYSSFGSEPEVMGNVVNGDTNSYTGIEYQAIAFKKFCYEFLNENINVLIEFLNIIHTIKKTRGLLRTVIFYYWFDVQQIDLISDIILRMKLHQIEDYLLSKRQKHIPPTAHHTP